MNDFEFHAPTSLADAFGLLERYGEDARPMSGGTALVVLMKQSLVNVGHVVSLESVPGLSEIRSDNGTLRIGGLVRHRDLETSAAVRAFAPFLCDVYSRVATVKIRNMATVGGGLAHADPAQDPPPAYLTLDASVRLASQSGERTLPIDELFTDYYETAINPGEILTDVIIQKPAASARFAYLKFLPRSEDDYATVAVAARGSVEGGVCSGVRVALASAAATPVRARAVERELEGKTPSAQAIRSAAEAVVTEIDPLDDLRGSSGYKRDMAVVFTRRALEQVLL
jgi:aerobic carbon-monoxide dehydrogenase medium subunit